MFGRHRRKKERPTRMKFFFCFIICRRIKTEKLKLIRKLEIFSIKAIHANSSLWLGAKMDPNVFFCHYRFSRSIYAWQMIMRANEPKWHYSKCWICIDVSIFIYMSWKMCSFASVCHDPLACDSHLNAIYFSSQHSKKRNPWATLNHNFFMFSRVCIDRRRRSVEALHNTNRVFAIKRMHVFAFDEWKWVISTEYQCRRK